MADHLTGYGDNDLYECEYCALPTPWRELSLEGNMVLCTQCRPTPNVFRQTSMQTFDYWDEYDWQTANSDPDPPEYLAFLTLMRAFNRMPVPEQQDELLRNYRKDPIAWHESIKEKIQALTSTSPSSPSLSSPPSSASS